MSNHPMCNSAYVHTQYAIVQDAVLALVTSFNAPCRLHQQPGGATFTPITGGTSPLNLCSCNVAVAQLQTIGGGATAGSE